MFFYFFNIQLTNRFTLVILLIVTDVWIIINIIVRFASFYAIIMHNNI
jgi:hypothetical protein